MSAGSPILTGSGLDLTARTRPRRHPRASIRRQLVFAGVLSVALVPGLAGWATMTSFAGAIIAPGQLVVESEIKKVQHPTGGGVGELLVKDGDHVRAGDVLIRLDKTQVQANLDITLKALNELAARCAREEAQRDGSAAILFPPDMAMWNRSSPEITALLDGDRRLFSARLASRDGQRAQMGRPSARVRVALQALKGQLTARPIARRQTGAANAKIAARSSDLVLYH